MIEDLCILGSTGSIGCQTLEVCRSLNIYPRYLACGKNVKRLAEQIREFTPRSVSVEDQEAAQELKELLSGMREPPEILTGESGRLELASRPSDRVLGAMSGFAGLTAILKAIETGHDIALANKETLVAAGDLVMRKAKEAGISIYPVDSEHSAIWQCLATAPVRNVRKLWLTASGGPFLHHNKEEMDLMTPARALRHPVWNMGAKISIDSASMMNKGLELIEAMHLFSKREDEIGIVVHPEGIIHSLVEMEDGALLAQLGRADMRIPIQLALTWPERVDGSWPRFDFFAEEVANFRFLKPDQEKFPSLRLAREAAQSGGWMPLVLNAANEVAVRAFLDERCTFGEIPVLVERAMEHFSSHEQLTDAGVDDIIGKDQEVRSWCQNKLKV